MPSDRVRAPESCWATTRSGQPCVLEAGPRHLCHMHDPEAPYAQQHPAARQRLLAREDVRMALAVTDGPQPRRDS